MTTDLQPAPAAAPPAAAVPGPPRSPLDRIAAPALALLGGVLTALALPPWGWWPLAIVGVVLFEIALGESPTARQRALRGALFAAGWMYIGMGWMVQLTAPGYVAAGLIFTTFHTVAALAAPVGPWRVLGRPFAHTLAEALRLSFPFGGVPLATMGISQVAGPLGGVARVGGVILLTWVVFQLGFALAALGRAVRYRAPRPPGALIRTHGAVGLAAVAIVIVLSLVAPRGAATGATLEVAAVQGGGEQGTTALEVPSSLVTTRHLEATATIDAARDLDLVLWPENGIDIDDIPSTPELEVFTTSVVREQIAAEAARLGVPISVGVTEDVRVQGSTARRYVNAQVVVAPDGEVVDRYEKVRRVPFGEYVPFRGLIEKVTTAVDRVGEAVAGTDRAVLVLPANADHPEVQMATVISWEVFFGGRAREGVVDGAELILNPTNGASYTGTIVQTQQIASSRLRAIETGRWVVQAAPTGFSAMIDEDGTVRQRSSISEQVVLYDTVELRTGRTWYVSIGDGPYLVLFGVAFLATIAVAYRERRRAGTLDT